MNEHDKELIVRLIDGRLRDGTNFVDAVLNLVGKWIEASGRVATSLDPIAVSAWAFSTLFAIHFFLTTDPYATLLQKAGLDKLLIGLGLASHGGDLPPPGVKPPPGILGQGPAPQSSVSGKWQLHIRYVGPYGPIDQFQYYDTLQLAQTGADYYANHTAGNWIVVEAPTQIVSQ